MQITGRLRFRRHIEPSLRPAARFLCRGDPTAIMKVKVNEYRTERLLVAMAAATVAVALRALTSGSEAVHAEHVLETFGRYEFRGIRLPQASVLNPATTAARPRVTGMILFRRSVQLERAACNVVELMPVEGATCQALPRSTIPAESRHEASAVQSQPPLPIKHALLTRGLQYDIQMSTPTSTPLRCRAAAGLHIHAVPAATALL